MGGVFLGLVELVQEKSLWKVAQVVEENISFREGAFACRRSQYLGTQACPCEIGCVLLGGCMSLWEEACICRRLLCGRAHVILVGDKSLCEGHDIVGDVVL